MKLATRNVLPLISQLALVCTGLSHWFFLFFLTKIKTAILTKQRKKIPIAKISLLSIIRIKKGNSRIIEKSEGYNGSPRNAIFCCVVTPITSTPKSKIRALNQRDPKRAVIHMYKTNSKNAPNKNNSVCQLKAKFIAKEKLYWF